MKAKNKRIRIPKAAKPKGEGSGVFEVPSHGRLARRGSTEIVDDVASGRRAGDRSSAVSS
jgi:hypothetical protein